MLAKAQSSIEAYNAMRLRMAEMARIAGEIGQGDLSSNVEVLSDRDQFGHAFAGMQGYLRDIAEAAETVSQGDVSVDVKAKSEADVLGTAFAEMQIYLREMVGAAERIAERDLSSTIAPRSERDALGIAFNRMTENVSAVLVGGLGRNRTAVGRLASRWPRPRTRPGARSRRSQTPSATSPPAPSARPA